MRTCLEGNRSDKLLRLFEFLFERMLLGDPPTERQIAEDVFSTGRIDPNRQDANVRVYVHRLRKLMEATFASVEGPRLELPAGAYKLRFVHQSLDEDILPGAAPASGIVRPRIVVAGRLIMGLVVLAGLFLLAVIYLVQPMYNAGPRLSTAMPWAAIRDSDRPITIVMGDYYLYAEFADKSDHRAAPTLVWDHSVPTREDLIIYQILNPASADKVVDFGDQYVTSGTLTAATVIRAALRRDAVFQRRPVQLIAASQLTAEVLKMSDVVYIGQLSGISAILRDPLLQASGLRLDAGLASLKDMETGKAYQSDGMELREEQIARRDYGYLARLPGPAGNNVFFIASIRDPGLKEMAEIAVDPQRLDVLPTALASSVSGFEALYQVRTMGNVNFGAAVVMKRTLHSQGVWDRSAATPQYRPLDSGRPAARQ
ncbi:MAG: hypothetical protein ABI395_00445 [Sphingobium sp.]